MRFSLLNIVHDQGTIVNGVWIEDHFGSLESATKRARATERVNGNRISVAVVEAISSVTPNYNMIFNQQRLDRKELKI